MSRTAKVTALMCRIVPVGPTGSSGIVGGSIIDCAGLENAGYAEVDGFYRFPSFGLCEGERCQQGYSVFNVKRHHAPREHCYATSFATDIRPLFRDSPDIDTTQGYGTATAMCCSAS